MSLKLDQLRKRLLLQQSGLDGVGRDNGDGKAGQAAVKGLEPQLIVTRAAPSVPPGNGSDRPSADELVDADDGPPMAFATVDEMDAPIPAADSTTASAAAVPARLEPTEALVAARAADDGATENSPAAPGVASDLGDAVAMVFAQTRALRDWLEALDRSLAPLERMGDSATRVLDPLRDFHGRMTQLARSFGPMRGLRSELAEMAKTFEPIRGLRDQMEQLTSAFESNLAELVVALEPARRLRERLEQLAIAIAQAGEMRERFSELRAMFTGAEADGAAPETTADVAAN